MTMNSGSHTTQQQEGTSEKKEKYALVWISNAQQKDESNITNQLSPTQ